MLSWVVTFLIIALIAGILGFGGIAGTSLEIAKIIFFIAVVLFLISPWSVWRADVPESRHGRLRRATDAIPHRRTDAGVRRPSSIVTGCRHSVTTSQTSARNIR